MKPSFAKPTMPVENTGSGAVVLPIDEEHFKSFISGLLGHPQTVESLVVGPFDLDRDNIRNICDLLHQRVTSQNGDALVNFSAKVSYDDESSVTLNSVQDFISYNEVKPLVSTALTLTWTYLVKFSGRVAPEKQEVQVQFLGGRPTSPGLEIDIGRKARFRQYTDGNIYIRISHTDRSWGFDIDSLLRSHLKGLIAAEPKLRKRVSEHSGWLGFGFGCLVMLTTIIALILQIRSIIAMYDAQIRGLSKATHGQLSLSAKVDFLLQIASHGAWTRLAFLMEASLIVGFIVSVVAGIIMSSAFTLDRQSFVLLTQRSYDRQERLTKRLERNWRHYVWSGLLTVALAIVANIITSVIITGNAK